ncbi:uncharacterized protein LOC132644643 [Lycium barbarum]|uniref:uncharacterized protein LOC132644643 n=1 Tax=Lycium barbarum TaxID=112863 RepID=UPI00293E9702|nr:uncharacterized protein LOC132644643 [Lycium barbarum]
MASSSKTVIMALLMIIITVSIGQATAARRLQQAGGFPGGFPSFPMPTTPFPSTPSAGGFPSFPMPTTPFPSTPSAGGGLPNIFPPFPPSSFPTTPAQTTTP